MARATIALSGACAVVLVAASNARADVLNFTVALDGAQANACGGTGSPATGAGDFTLDTDTGEVTFEISISGLLGTETGSHVHGAAPECTDAGVVYSLPTGSPKIGTMVLSPQQAQDMINGLHYVNVHTDLHTGGEIRGQVLPVAPTWAFGLPFAPLGAATLALDPAGTLMVSNIGSSGQDGVSVETGEIEGWLTEVDFGRAGFLSPGTRATYRGQPGIGHPKFATRIEESGGGSAQVFVDSDTPGSFVERVDLFLGDLLVDTVDYNGDPDQPIILGNIGSSGKDGVRCGLNYGWWGHCNDWCPTSVIAIPAPTNLAINGRPPVLADRVVMFLPDGAPVRSKVTMTFANVVPSDVVIKGKKILQNFVPNGATGDARMQGVADLNGDGRPDLVVSNIGSSGIDGVQMGLPNLPGGAEAQEEDLTFVLDPTGPTLYSGFIRMTVTTSVTGSGSLVVAADLLLSHISPSTTQLSTDVSGLGSSNVEVYAWSGGGFTGTSTTLPALNFATVSTPTGSPRISDFGMSRTLPDNPSNPDGMVVCFENEVLLTLANGTPPVLCDCLHLIANNPTEEIDKNSSCWIRTAQLPAFTVFDVVRHTMQILSGLPTRNTGATVYGWDYVKKEAIVGNIGSSGEDGVSIGIGEGEGWGGEIAFPEGADVTPGHKFTITEHPANDAPELAVELTGNAGGGTDGALRINGAPPTSGQATVRGYAGGALVHEQVFPAPLPQPLFTAPLHAQNGKAVMVTSGAFVVGNDPPLAGGGPGSHARVKVQFHWDQTSTNVVVGSTSVGGLDELQIIYEDASTPVLDPLYTGALITGMTPLPQTKEHILLARQVGINWGHWHEAAAGTEYVFQRNESDLQFLRMRASGNTTPTELLIFITPRIEVEKNHQQQECRGFSMNLTANDNGGNNENWNFTGRAAINITPGNDEIANASLNVVGGQREVSVGPVRWMAPESITSRVYNGAALVGESSGLPPGIVATAIPPQTPGSYVFELVVTDNNGIAETPTGVRHKFVWDTARDIGLPGVGIVFGDRLEVEMTGTPAEGPVPNFDLETLEFGVDSSTGNASIDIADEAAVWHDTCPADTNANTTVDVVDLLAVLGAWGPCPAPCPPSCDADVNNDCVVDVQDLLAVLGAWGPCP